MSEHLRERVQARLDALQINPFEAARRAGLERSFVNDLLIGKKSTMREAKLVALADALDCDVAYLRGFQNTPRAGIAGGAGQPLAGICEAGVWREPGADIPAQPIPFTPDPRYPISDQELYLVRGNHAAGFGITDGSLLVVVKGAAIRDGDHVVVRRRRPSGEIETSVRVQAGGALSASPPAGNSQIAPILMDDAEIVGLIAISFRVFG
ncbi:hypothetical protein [Microcystis phage Mae-JY30]